MDCWFCGHDLIWGADFDPEDYGYEGTGIVATLSCPNCGSSWTGVQIFEEEMSEEERLENDRVQIELIEINLTNDFTKRYGEHWKKRYIYKCMFEMEFNKLVTDLIGEQN